jgi:UDP-N-acetylmuramoyl-L-alanyl-D-glutamate--2,6-diaminopimelate ligase
VIRTTPEAIDLQHTFREMLDAGDRSCAMEASSHAAALKRLVGVRFAALVFTNLSQDHLDFHGTMADYFEAKRRLFVASGPDGHRPPAVVNVADPHGRRLADELRGLGETVMTFGLAPDADVSTSEMEVSAAGSELETTTGLRIRTPLRGSFNVENVLGAVAAAGVLGIGDEAVRRGIEHVQGVPGRFEAVEAGQPFTVLIDYAHTPEALESVLAEARLLASGRLICVFGCGGDRDREKRSLMGEVATRLADSVLITSDNPRSEDPLAIIEEILAGAGPGAAVEPDRAAAIERAIQSAGEGDVVVVAGRGHEPGQEIAGRIIPFDDREVARDALRRLAAEVSA